MEYPQELLKEFEGTPGGYSWISARNPALLDYRGAEFILIGADPDLGALRCDLNSCAVTKQL